ncbi:MAG: hypothetical protein ACQEQC_02990 [Elusimicrobiota bacterium]
MQENNLEKVLGLLENLRELELKVAQFYNTAAEKWDDESNYWNTLAAEEEKHAASLRRMGEIIQKNPNKFDAGRVFNPVAVKTVIRGIDENIERLKKDKIDLKKMIFIALDIENSLLENKYREIVNSNNLEFTNLVKEITEDTQRHRNKLNIKKDEIRKNDR